MKPLPKDFELPDYGTLRAEHAEAALRAQIATNRAAIERLLDDPEPSFRSLVEPFEGLQARIGRVFAPVAHLNSVTSTAEIRAAYNACLEALTEDRKSTRLNSSH